MSTGNALLWVFRLQHSLVEINSYRTECVSCLMSEQTNPNTETRTSLTNNPVKMTTLPTLCTCLEYL